MQSDKKPASKPKGPDRAAVDALMKVIHDGQKAKPLPGTPPPPESLPDDWGIGDLVRVGKSRLSRAVFGPPKPSEPKKK